MIPTSLSNVILFIGIGLLILSLILMLVGSGILRLHKPTASPNRSMVVGGLILALMGLSFFTVRWASEAPPVAQVEPIASQIPPSVVTITATATLPTPTLLATLPATAPYPPPITTTFVVPTLGPIPSPEPPATAVMPLPTPEQLPPQEVYAQKLSVTIPSGDAQDSLSVPRYASAAGPESFAINPEGNIYICDTLNQRVQVFSATGVYQSTISMPNHTNPNDIAIDDDGNIYVLANTEGKLYQYDHEGQLQQHIPVYGTGRRIHISYDTLYRVNVGAASWDDHPIGNIVNGQLEPHTQAEGMPSYSSEGVHGRTSNILYSTITIDETSGYVRMFDPAANVTRTVQIVVPGLLSLEFLEEDGEENFYIQVQRSHPEEIGILLEVHKYNPQGRQMSRIPIPEIEYQTWTVKLLDVDANGTIYQFMPMFDGPKLNTFEPIREL